MARRNWPARSGAAWVRACAVLALTVVGCKRSPTRDQVDRSNDRDASSFDSGSRQPPSSDAGGAAADSGNDRDAGAARDAASDANTPDATAASCVTAGTELCEDFESGSLHEKKWALVKPTASAKVTVDATRPHLGRYSLHIQVVPGQSSIAQIADAVTFPAGMNAFYTRAYFYFAPDLPADSSGGYHMAFLLATGNNDLGYVEAGLGSAGNKQYLGYSEYFGAGPDIRAHGPTFTEFGPRSKVQVVPMKWICLELFQGGDATTTTRRVWVDGSELLEQRNMYSGRKPPAFSRMSIGVLQYHKTPLLSDVWVDDIRVSQDPIGCDD